jgi:retron-type reverse transcriptase
MGKLLDRVASEQTLLEAWDDVHENAMDGGDPSEAIEDFAREAASNIARISDGLIDGSWTPKPVVHFQVPKKGGKRNLGIPSIEDRIVDRAVKDVLDELIDPLLMPWSVAYRKGMGVQTAIGHLLDARDEGRTWVVRCDIKDCFPQIPRTDVLQRLYEVCPDPALSELVRKLVHRRLVGRNAPRLPRGRGLHQGSPLSPLLANLYLDRFDRSMADEGFVAVRYADDIAIPVVSRVEGERALAQVDTVFAPTQTRTKCRKERHLFPGRWSGLPWADSHPQIRARSR